MSEMDQLDLIPVAATNFHGHGMHLDRRLFEKVIALRDRTYLNEEEREPVEAIMTRLEGSNQEKDPVNLEIFALADKSGEVKAFSIIETYLDQEGKPISGCMTYANADPHFARERGAMAQLKRLHDKTIEGKDYPIIVETNPGDKRVRANAADPDQHPFAFDNNQDPLVVEMAIKLGIDPSAIPIGLINKLERQADEDAPKGGRLSKREVKEIIESGENILRDAEGRAVSAIVPATYNTLNLQPNEKLGKVGELIDLTQGGPGNLHLALINIPQDGKGHAYKDASKAYKDLSKSIAIGNTGLSPRVAELAVKSNFALRQTHHEIEQAESHAIETGMGARSDHGRIR